MLKDRQARIDYTDGCWVVEACEEGFIDDFRFETKQEAFTFVAARDLCLVSWPE